MGPTKRGNDKSLVKPRMGLVVKALSVVEDHMVTLSTFQKLAPQSRATW
jgi:hypothetical protein